MRPTFSLVGSALDLKFGLLRFESRRGPFFFFRGCNILNVNKNMVEEF